MKIKKLFLDLFLILYLISFEIHKNIKNKRIKVI